VPSGTVTSQTKEALSQFAGDIMGGVLKGVCVGVKGGRGVTVEGPELRLPGAGCAARPRVPGLHWLNRSPGPSK